MKCIWSGAVVPRPLPPMIDVRCQTGRCCRKAEVAKPQSQQLCMTAKRQCKQQRDNSRCRPVGLSSCRRVYLSELFGALCTSLAARVAQPFRLIFSSVFKRCLIDFRGGLQHELTDHYDRNAICICLSRDSYLDSRSRSFSFSYFIYIFVSASLSHSWLCVIDCSGQRQWCVSKWPTGERSNGATGQQALHSAQLR